MDSTKLIALVAAGSSASSMLSGSLFSESGTRRVVVKPKLANPFALFDLYCLDRGNYGPQNNAKKFIFSGYDNMGEHTQLLNKVQPITASAPLSLTAPKNSGNVEGCYKIDLHQAVITPKKEKPTEKEWHIVAARIEMALSKGNYGIILLNTTWNTKDFGGKTNVFRAVFLEKENSKDWKIKGGIHWTDEALMKSSKTAKRLEMEGANLTNGKKHIAWLRDFSKEVPFADLVNKNSDAKAYTWNSDSSKEKTIFQELSVKPEPPIEANTENFWNGTPEPNVSLSNVALFDTSDKLWKKTTVQNIDLTAVKPWFALFKEEKGTWGTMPAK